MTLAGLESALINEVEGLKKSVSKLKKESEHGGVKLMYAKLRSIQK